MMTQEPTSTTHRRRFRFSFAQSEGPSRKRRWLLLALLGGVAMGLGWMWFGPRQDSAAATLITSASQTKPAASVEETLPAVEVKPLELCIQQLQHAKTLLAATPDMEDSFHKQERIDGVLGDVNRIQLKVRREPLSVYMRWQTAPEGREILWQDGQHDGYMLVQAGGWQKLLLPVLKIDPHGEQAMSNSRHPINEVGLWNMTEKLLKAAQDAQQETNFLAEYAEVNAADERACHCFTLQPAAESACTYRKLVILIDKELKVPLGFQVFNQVGDKPEAVLEESYLYQGLKLNASLTDLDFDQANPAYEFRKK